jgi:2'-5' RNA ligase
VKVYVALTVEGVAEIQVLRTQFDFLFSQVPAHLTLVFPLETNEVDFEAIRVIAKETSPIDAMIAGPSGSPDHLMYLTLTQGNDSVIALHRRLYQTLFPKSYDRIYSYLPHVTVGRFDDKKDMVNAIHNTPMIEPASVRLDKMIIVEICSGGDRKILEKLSLAGSKL